MLTKKEKEIFIKDFREKLKKYNLVVFCNFQGLKIEDQQKLQREFKKNNGEVFVAKNTLIQKALEQEKVDVPKITNQTIVGLSTDEISAAKIFKIFQKEKKDIINYLFGITREGDRWSVINKEYIEEIASISSKEDLLAQLLNTIKAPIMNLNFILKGNIQKLIYVLSNISK
ncbi:MAG: 50S ribosomal protein L10 [Candidatus Pacebacteria bacterium]|nr:50S ribosomal protein L10 [Candidatus Paceibacterota bacterium]